MLTNDQLRDIARNASPAGNRDQVAAQLNAMAQAHGYANVRLLLDAIVQIRDEAEREASTQNDGGVASGATTRRGAADVAQARLRSILGRIGLSKATERSAASAWLKGCGY